MIPVSEINFLNRKHGGIFTHFIENPVIAAPWILSPISGGTSNVLDVKYGAMGVLDLSTLNSTTVNGNLIRTGFGFTPNNAHRLRLQSQIALDILPDYNPDYTINVGFLDASDTANTGALAFVYESKFAPFLNCRVRDASTTTDVATAVSMQAQTWFDLVVEYNQGAVNFYVNGALVYSANTGLPLARLLAPAIAIKKYSSAVLTGVRTISIDSLDFSFELV
jgi:hypothetical protein